MKRRKKVHMKYKNIVLLLFIILAIFIVIKLMGNSKLEEEKEKIDYLSFKGKDILELEKALGEEKITINKEYKYSTELDEEKIIEIKESEEGLQVILSKGLITDSLYSEKKVNELGKVPIMMYHGIVDTTENKYTGGNVDKDGYNRTANAFRQDLEFYYEKGYRMIRLEDYINGVIDVELGYSPIILTFDDGNKNNINILGKNEDGSLKIDPNSAVGVLEEFKKKHPDATVTATFFLMNDLFNQKEYNEEIVNWMVDNGYDIGNHTTSHPDFTKISTDKTREVVGKMYQKLDSVLKNRYVKIVALPYGSPYKKSHENFAYILKGEYNGYSYETEAALRVGWEPEVSPFNKDFDKTFLKRCRAYDNNGKEFDIEMVFKNLESNRYISDGDKDLIVIKESDKSKLNTNYSNVHTY